jgi:hypothetical protein
VSRFARSWLALREPYDHAARSKALADRFGRALGQAPRLIDLGCGAGANLRYLGPRLPPAQHWLCLDRDRDLLVEADAVLGDWRRTTGWQGSVRLEACDLAASLDLLTHHDALTASALLDLTSAAWLDCLSERCRGTPLLMALSFDGRLVWEPGLAEDDVILARFLAHQGTDKGFGPALGPDAAAHLAGRLEAIGHRVTSAKSDWRLGPADQPLLEAMLDGVIAAVAEIEQGNRLDLWADQRRRQLAGGELGLTVGHVDLLALPPRP